MGVDLISLDDQGRGAGATTQDATPLKVHRANQPSQRRMRDNSQGDRPDEPPACRRLGRRFSQTTRGGGSGGAWLLPKRLGEPVGTAAPDDGRLAQLSSPTSPIPA